MRGPAFFVYGLALVVVTVLTALASMRTEAQVSTPRPGEQLLAFDVAFHDTVLAANTATFSLGDRIILNDRLLANGTEVGHNAGVCTITDNSGGGEALCNVTWALPDGTISTQLLNTPPPQKTFAIIGGTGGYQGARG